MKKSNGNDKHVWSFSRIGGVNRVNLTSGDDLLNLEHLDQKLWTALSCPVHGLEIDSKTLELIDTDSDGRIRVPEVIEAVRWVTAFIKNPDELTIPGQNLPLKSINDSTPEGKNLLESAKQILDNIGTPDAGEISVEQTSDTVRIFANTKFNGDGIITEDSTSDEKLKAVIREIISCTGSAADRSGREGIGMTHLESFFTSCSEYSDWYTAAERDGRNVLPFGESTASSLDAFLAVKAKAEDYFIRCRLARYSPASSETLNSLGSKFEELRFREISELSTEILSLPLATINPDKSLILKSGLNPAWEKAMQTFVSSVVDPLFPKCDKLTEEDFQAISRKFDPYQAWISGKKGAAVEKLGLARIRELLASSAREQLVALVESDLALSGKANSIIQVDRLARYYRDIFRLLLNYVTFHDFYSPDETAIFQAGKLYIDQRCADLCLRVSDMAKHNTLARTSGLCLIYCDCVSKELGETMTIVAALTDGDIDNIEVGRNGIFYDRKGKDWDATIVRIVDNPISIRQAFWSPYRKVSRFINSQIEKMAVAKDKEVTSAATSGIEKGSAKIDAGINQSIQGAPPAAAPAAPPQPFDIGKFVGIFAAISLALGALGSAITSIVTGFLALAWWMMPVAIAGVMLLISGPAMIIAWLKLRKRNLAPVLDANGWAVNARATINIIFGNTLTHLAALPDGAKLNLADPFTKKRRPLIPIIIITLLILAAAIWLLWHFGLLVKWGII